MSTLNLTFVIGCTACGKSSAGFELARRIGGELVVCDSMKVYRRMNIGTAKPSDRQLAAVPHHLVDVVEPWEEFSVARYVALADQAIQEIHGRRRPVVVVGGTALYLKGLAEGLFEGPGEDPAFREQLRRRAETHGTERLHAELQRIDPEAAARIHPNDYRRVERALEVFERSGLPISQMQTQWAAGARRYDCRFAGLRRDKDEQSRRINARVRRMMQDGWLDEVRGLLAGERPLSRAAAQAVGYRELIDHVRGTLPLAEAVEQIKIRTRQLAKSQRTWFRRFPAVTWLDLDPDDPPDRVADRLGDWYADRRQ